MYSVLGLILVITFARVTNVASNCAPVPNDDILEYFCNGGTPEDIMLLSDKVEKLKITNMHIPLVTANMFSKFGPNLYVLICSYCEIRDIEPDAFRSLVNLQQLALDDNHLTVVKGSWFKGLDWLSYVDFTYNDITTVEDSVFENLPALMDLRLSGNRLRCLNTEAMSNLYELRRLFLNENPNFKCPNAVENFLKDRGLSFERDPEWKEYDEEVIEAMPSPELSTVTNLPPVIQHLLPTTTAFNPYTEESRAPYYIHTEPISTPEVVTTAVYPQWITTPENRVTTQIWPPINPYSPPNSATERPEETAVSAEIFPTPIWRNNLVTTEPAKIYWTSDMDDSFIEVEHPQVYSEFENVFDESTSISGTESSKIDNVHMNTLYVPPTHPQIVQPTRPEDLQVPYYEPTETIRPPFRHNENQPTTVTALNEESTTTDKPLPHCPSNSACRRMSLKELIASLALFVILRNIVARGF